MLSRSGQHPAWHWRKFGNTKSSWPGTRNPSNPWWCYVRETGIGNKKALVIWTRKRGNIKKVHEKLLIPQNCREICNPKFNRDIFRNNNIPGWIKRADKRSQNCQASVVKAIAGNIKLWDNLLKAEKQNYVVNTKDLLSLPMESIMLLGHENFSMNNTRRNMIKIVCKKICLPYVKQVIPLPLCF